MLILTQNSLTPNPMTPTETLDLQKKLLDLMNRVQSFRNEIVELSIVAPKQMRGDIRHAYDNLSDAITSLSKAANNTTQISNTQ